MKFYRKSARFKTGLLRGVAAAALAWLAVSSPAEPPAPAAWRVTIAGFLRPAGTFVAPIAGAHTTQYAAACATEAGGIRYLSQEEFAALGVDWETFRAGSASAASAQLAQLRPEWIRDRNQVIECAILRVKNPADDVTAAVLAPDFLKRFTPVFGRKMLLAIPDRQTVYLFPRLASRYQDYAERVLSVYRKSAEPVSREVLELSATGLRAMGEYQDTRQSP